MARSEYCSLCKLEKGLGRDNETYCKSCKHKKRSEARAKLRAEKGLQPWGMGPSKVCSDCESVKEDVRQSYCNKCRSIRNKEWAHRTGRASKYQTGLCPCGAERKPTQRYFCTACKRENSRRYNELKGQTQANRDSFNAWYNANKEEFKVKRKEDHYYRLKNLARSTTNNAIASGILFRKPCEVCGINMNVEAHHDDYTQPLNVKWLCIKHHKELHRKG